MKKILFVEDDPGCYPAITTALLQRAGYGTIHFYSGEEVVEYLSEKGNPFSLALVDRSLPPPVSGDQLVTLLKKKYPSVPVVMLTASGMNAPEADGMLIKPYRNEELLRVVEARIGPGEPGK